MNCPACEAQLPDDAVFCGQCAQPLRSERSCPSCGRSNPPEMRFCLGCGHRLDDATAAPERDPRDYTPKHLADKILQSKSALEGERKQVTVLFADVKGSVALSDALDPEDWHELLDELFGILTSGVHRFEGTVNQYTGDGIMAIFGAPLALEDHAQRACHAALHVRDVLRDHALRLRVERGIDLRVRIALNSGEVVVGAIGDDLRMDYTAQGSTVGLAARIQEAAAPESVYVSESTASLVSGWFELRDLGHTRFRGLTAPVRLHELKGATQSRTRLEVARERGLTPFVGRSEELAVLERALDRVGAGEGQIVGVVGEAGVGKSRLCLEFAGLAADRGASVCVAACPSHAATLPFFLLRELIRSFLGIGRDAGPGLKTTAAVTARLSEIEPGLKEQAGLVLELLQLPDPSLPPPALDAEARRRLVLETLRQILMGRAQHNRLVVLLDDLHWIDAESDALLAELVEGVPETRALLLANFRPEYRSAWMQRTHYQQLGLGALAADRTAELVRAILGDDPSLGDLAEHLHDATRGNPFFVEEVVRALVERGALTGEPRRYQRVEADALAALPSTVQSVLAARIDRLEEQDKEVLRAAAVAGRRFRGRDVASMTGRGAADISASLEALCAAELLRREHAHPEPEYAFRHPLTHEVAYDTQLRGRRRALHAALAWALAQEPASAAAEGASLVAHHLELAGQLLEAARWRWRAVQVFGWSDAAGLVPHLRQVVRLTDALTDDPQAARIGIWARTRGLADAVLSNRSQDEARRWFRDGTIVAERLRHLPALAALHGWYANFLLPRNEREEAHDAAEAALRLATESGNRRALIQISYGVLQVMAAEGRFDEALALSEKVLDAASTDLSEVEAVVVSHARMLRAELLAIAGRLHEALEAADEALAEGTAVTHPQVEVGISQLRADVYFFLGEWERQLETARLSVGQANAWQGLGYRSSSRRHVGFALLCLGRPAEALAVLDECVAFEAQGTMHGWSGLLELLRARALVALGRADAALREGDEAWQLLCRQGRADVTLWGHWHFAQVLLGVDARAEHARIEALLDRFDAKVGTSGALAWKPYVRMARADLAAAIGDLPAARHQRELAAKELRAMDAVAAAERLEAELAVAPGNA